MKNLFLLLSMLICSTIFISAKNGLNKTALIEEGWPATIYVTVKDASGTPISGATVRFRDLPGIATSTDPSGQASLGSVVPGVVIQVSAVGYLTVEFTVVASKTHYDVILPDA